jgi:hypothetical protein
VASGELLRAAVENVAAEAESGPITAATVLQGSAGSTTTPSAVSSHR